MKSTSGILAASLLLTPFAAFAADAPPGAASCSGCHATNATAETPVPKIHGRSAAETVTLMTAFRNGSKPATVMDRVAKGFSEDETQAIADWLATQR